MESACRRWAARRITCWCCRTPTWMAADAAVSAAYGAAGQRCMAISVVVAVGDVADPLVAAIAKRIPKIKVGPGLEQGSEMGPLVTREQRDRVASYLDHAAADGAIVAVDGRLGGATEREGFFLGRFADRSRRTRHALLRTMRYLARC